MAERKVRALLASGATVRVVAPEISAGLRALALEDSRLTVIPRAYMVSDVAEAHLVVAATDVPAVNDAVACDAHAQRRLVNVTHDPAAGNFMTVAAHRPGGGPLLIAVSAGGVPVAAARIRDSLAARFDTRYATAVDALGRLRRALLQDGDRAGWRRAVDTLLSEDFCERVEAGDFADEVTQWR